MADRKAVPVDRGWLLTMTDMGVEPSVVLRRAELPLDLFAQENARLTVAEYFRFWQTFADDVAEPAFPIKMAESISTEAFHPMIFAALCSPNLMVAARRIAKYKHLIVPVTVTAEERPEGFFVGKKWDHVDQVPMTLTAVDLTLHTQLARIGTRRRIEPVRVVSPQPLEPKEAYRVFFGVAPERGEDVGVTFRKADASRPFVTASEVVWRAFEPELQRQLSKIDAEMPLSERVRLVLLESLPSGEASIERTARRLGLSARTLQRRLKPEGVSFKEVVRRTRERLARHYLTKTELGYAEISFLIGFEEPSSFFRAFRTWTGVTPESMRVSA